MKYMFSSLMFLLFVLNMISCDKEIKNESNCALAMYISENDFNNGPFDSNTTLNYIEYDGECINFNVSFSGCGEHEMQVVTDGNVAESEPPRLYFGIVHENLDLCEAYITQTLSVHLDDISMLEGYTSIILLDKNSDKEILIELD